MSDAQTRTGPTDQNLVALRGVTRAYREGGKTREVLRGIDLDIRAGECLALLGRSGSGKSTLLNIIGGIDQPDAGAVTIDGVEITRLSERDRTLFRRRHIGFVHQQYNLIPTLTVAENLRLPLELNGRDATATQTIAALLEQVGLADRMAAYPEELSGGEQQRVAIARALVHEPLLILADEPTGTLDARIGGDVLRLFERLVRERGRTLIMVTHSKAVSAIADRVRMIEDGQLRDAAAEVAW